MGHSLLLEIEDIMDLKALVFMFIRYCEFSMSVIATIPISLKQYFPYNTRWSPPEAASRLVLFLIINRFLWNHQYHVP